jgi:hypothetical protein
VAALAVIFSILLPITVIATWGHNVVLNTNGWVRTVGPIAANPVVMETVSREVTDQLYSELNPQQVIAGALPPQASFLAGPIANGAKGYIQDAITKILQSAQFEALWVQANRFAHAQLVAVLRGNSKTVQTSNGQVVLNLVPLLNAALQNVQGFVSGVVGKPVSLPTISGNEVPSAACAKIGAALDRPVPSTCGQIALFPASKLTQARDAVRAFDRIVVLLLILTPVVAAVALWQSRRRRRTLLQLTVGGFLGLVVARRALLWTQHTLVNTGKPENKAARQVILDQVLHALFTVTFWFLVALLVVLVVTVLTAPYGWARALRHRIARMATEAGNFISAVAGKTHDDAAASWVRHHLDVLRIGGVLIAALLLLVLSVSFVGFLIIFGLLAIYELGLHRLARRTAGAEPAASPPAA